MLVLFLIPIMIAAESFPIERLVPAYMNGWRSDRQEAIYDRTNLFDYINGAAEVYLAYDFRRCFARRFILTGKPAITVDVFDMGSSADAYGNFTFEREGDDVGIGTDSEYSSGFLRFWKGRYYVSVLADLETPQSRKTVMDLGRAIEKRITSECTRPGIVSLLPTENLIKNSVRFFHQKSGLDYHYYLSDENLLSLGKDTDVLLAQYLAEGSKSQLLIVEYPTENAAARALLDLKASDMPDAGADSAVRTERGKWVSADRRANILVAVFEAPDRQIAGRLARQVMEKAAKQ